MRTYLFIAISALLQFSVPLSAAEPEPPFDPQALTDQITSGDAVQINAAVAEIRRQLSTGTEVAGYHAGGWIPALLKAERYAEVAEVCSAAILCVPHDTTVLQSLTMTRAEALLSAGKNEEALQAAKAYFNIATMESTAGALQLINKALDAVNKDDPNISRKFRMEQLAGAATTQPFDDAQGGPNDAPPLTSATLKSIQIDPKPYEAKLSQLKNHPSQVYPILVATGNLLLLSDKPDEAKPVFEAAQGLAGEDQVSEAAEHLARVIKAQDGTIGRANAYVLSLRPGE